MGRGGRTCWSERSRLSRSRPSSAEAERKTSATSALAASLAARLVRLDGVYDTDAPLRKAMEAAAAHATGSRPHMEKRAVSQTIACGTPASQSSGTCLPAQSSIILCPPLAASLVGSHPCCLLVDGLQWRDDEGRPHAPRPAVHGLGVHVPVIAHHRDALQAAQTGRQQGRPGANETTKGVNRGGTRGVGDRPPPPTDLRESGSSPWLFWSSTVPATASLRANAL